MPRISRGRLKARFFHVIVQGINKSYIFEHFPDAKYYIKLMYELKQVFRVNIIAYCVMSNHVHILLQTSTVEELSKYIQRLNTKYARYYNKKYNRVGYVFRGRFKSEGIYDNKYLYNCMKYIYNNPVKAGLCDAPEQYPYSNYKKIEFDVNETYGFIDVDEDKTRICNEGVDRFLKNNNLELHDLKKDKMQLIKLIVTLKNEYNISLREIAIQVGIGRELTRKLYNTSK